MIYEIHVTRYSNLIMNNVIFPAILMSVLMFLILILPTNIIDKIPLVLSLLLIITVYQLIIMQTVPATKNNSIAEKIIFQVFVIGGLISILAFIAQMLLVDKFNLIPLPKF